MSAYSGRGPRQSFLVGIDIEMGSDGLERVYTTLYAGPQDPSHSDVPPGSHLEAVVVETLCYLRFEKGQVVYH